MQRRKKSKSDENFEKFHQAGQSNPINDQKVTFTKNHHFGQFEMSGEFLPVIQKESLIQFVREKVKIVNSYIESV